MAALALMTNFATEPVRERQWHGLRGKLRGKKPKLPQRQQGLPI